MPDSESNLRSFILKRSVVAEMDARSADKWIRDVSSFCSELGFFRGMSDLKDIVTCHVVRLRAVVLENIHLTNFKGRSHRYLNFLF
jgi:hypothetical protein